MPNAPVLLVMVTAPAEMKLMPSVPLAGVIAVGQVVDVEGGDRRRGGDGNPGGLIAGAGLDGAGTIDRAAGRQPAPPAPGRLMPATARRRQPCPEMHPGNANRSAGPRPQCRSGKPRRSSSKFPTALKYNLRILILNGTARVYPGRLPQSANPAKTGPKTRQYGNTGEKIVRNELAAAAINEKVMRRGSRFQVVPHSNVHAA